MSTPWEVEYTDQFGVWWDTLDDETQRDVDSIVRVLKQRGPALTRPYSDAVKGSRHPNLRELRVQSKGRPLRVFYAFDPRRSAILLIGGDKTGDPRFYKRLVRAADQLYDDHLRAIGMDDRG